MSQRPASLPPRGYELLRSAVRAAVALIERGGPAAAADAVAPLRAFLQPGAHVRFSAPTPDNIVEYFARDLLAAVEKKAWYAMTLLIAKVDELVPEQPTAVKVGTS